MEPLPKEVQAFILSKLDGRSLVMAQRVCQVWYDIIHSLERHFQIWLLSCLKEISLDILVELTELRELLLLAETRILCKCKRLPWKYWRDIYAEYSRCDLIQTREAALTELCYYQRSGLATCVALKDYQLFSGHEDGSVMCWKNVDHQLECSLTHKHYRVVTDISISTTGSSVEKMMLGLNDTLVVTSSQDSKIIVNNLGTRQSTCVHHYSKQVNTVSCYGELFVAGGNGNILHGQPVWEILVDSESKDLNVHGRYKLFGHESSVITSVAIWNNTVLAGDDIGYLYNWKLNPNDEGVSNEKQLGIIANMGSMIKKLMFKNNIVVCLTADGILHISTNGKDFRKQNVYLSLQKVPECIAWRGPLFVIGTKTGFLFMYLLKHDKDWESLDLSNPVKTLKTDSEHINSVAIGDDGVGPVVAMTTELPIIKVYRWKKS